ncbi:MAG: transcription termination/antitermination protein NusG [Thermoanaerobaculia bacterium]
MPILKPEPDIYPHDLFLPDTRHDGEWWVAHVRSRQEKFLARHLMGRVGFYLPQSAQETLRAGRKFTSYVPLFGGYVFVHGSADDRRIALASGVVVSMLDVVDQQQLAAELTQLHALQTSGALLAPHAWLGPGDPVTITDGVFKGYRGTITRERGTDRLVVSVSMLRQSVAVEIQRDCVIPAAIEKRGRGAQRAPDTLGVANNEPFRGRGAQRAPDTPGVARHSQIESPA